MSKTATRADSNPHLTIRNLILGVLGGLVGSILTGLLSYLAPVASRYTPFFVAVTSQLQLGISPVVSGWLLTILIGMAVGALFGLAVGKVKADQGNNAGFDIGLGLVVGVASWIFVFLPLMASAKPELLLDEAFTGWSFVSYAIFGVALGAVTGLGHAVFPERKLAQFECELCGELFKNHDDLRDHFRRIHLEKKNGSG